MLLNNIGGKTCIVAEDLVTDYVPYGFFVDYNEEHRLLTICSYSTVNPYSDYEGTDTLIIKRGTVGSVLGNIYATDIKVVFNGHEVKGYNIGGKTAICIEDLGTLDDGVNSKFGYSKYLAKFTWDEMMRTVALSSVYLNTNDMWQWQGLHSFIFSFTNNVLTAQYDPMNDYNNSHSYYGYNPSEMAMADYYTLYPFYVKVDGQRHEAGVCFRVNSWKFDDIVYYLNDKNKIRDLLIKSIPPKKTYDEAMKNIYDDPNYTVLDWLDNDGYTVLTLLANENDINNNLHEIKMLYFVAVKKTGGLIKFNRSGSYPGYTVTLDGNTVAVTVPTSVPFGATSMVSKFDLDEFQF